MTTNIYVVIYLRNFFSPLTLASGPREGQQGEVSDPALYGIGRLPALYVKDLEFEYSFGDALSQKDILIEIEGKHKDLIPIKPEEISRYGSRVDRHTPDGSYDEHRSFNGARGYKSSNSICIPWSSFVGVVKLTQNSYALLEEGGKKYYQIMMERRSAAIFIRRRR